MFLHKLLLMKVIHRAILSSSDQQNYTIPGLLSVILFINLERLVMRFNRHEQNHVIPHQLQI